MKKKVPVQKTIAPTKKDSSVKRILGFFIFAFAFLLYAQSISFDYAADDSSVTTENKLTKQGLKGIPEILKTDYWYGAGALRVPQYRPLPLVVLAVEWEFFPANPKASHFINVLLYAITCWLLFLLLCRLFTTQNLIFPFAVCLLFASHPIHTEVVSNIKSGDEILCFLFAVLSCLLVLKYINQKKTAALIFVGVFYFISLLAKETGIAFLLIVPIMLFFFTSATKKKIAGVTILYALVTALFLLIRAAVLSSIEFSRFDSMLNNSLYAAPDFISQKATAFFILFKYVLLLFLPHPLSYDYSFFQIPTQSFTDIGALAAIGLYLAIGIIAIINFRKKNIIAFGLLFYLLTLAPVSNLFILIGATMAERFLYMPSLGFCTLVAYLLVRLFKTKQAQNSANTLTAFLSSYKSLLAVVTLITVFYSAKTFARSSDWKNDLTLFGNDVKIATNSARAHYNWGTVLLQQLYPNETDEKKKNEILDNALAEFDKAITIYPNYTSAHTNKGLIYKKKGDTKNGIQSFETAIKLSLPKASLYYDLGDLYLQDGQFQKAVEAFDSGLNLNTLMPDVVYSYRGIALFRLQKYEEALTSFQKEIELNRNSQSAYKNTGACLMNLKRFPEAANYFKEAVRLDSSDITSINSLVSIYKYLGDTLNTGIYSDIAAHKR